MANWNTADYVVEDANAATLQASERGMKAFREAVSGLSVHWGLYSVLGRNEWCLNLDAMEHEAYFKTLMPRFNPARFCAEEWADLLLEAGQKFFIITTKHHDGFCMWDTALNDKKVTNTAFRRDVCAELATAMQERGIKVHWYHSLLDWTHPAYRKRETWPEYREYLHAQLRELLTHYGPIHGVVFDGYWPRLTCDEADPVSHFKEKGDYRFAAIYDLIHGLQPDAMVANNHHTPMMKGEDYQVWELDLPGENSAGFSGGATVVSGSATAAWLTLGKGWSYQPDKHAVCTAADMMNKIRRTRVLGGTMIINVGPRSFGDIHPEEARVLRQIGTQMREELIR
ncbi:MAG: alpha-L-fucosidase [Kiritimatiellaeota bacterium]|nr:alpha-L-fucosidase [Kiritimatiellota bacterium]